jgi:DNA-binding NarL/FixJ family response regulator
MSQKVSNLWIIDDDPMSSFYIKRLAELGELARIITIYDKARGAVDYLLHHKQSPEHLPDIILLDIYMPDMDGWTFLQEYEKIKSQLSKNIKIFIISSTTHPKDIYRAESLPQVKAFLQKPITMESLRKAVFGIESPNL